MGPLALLTAGPALLRAVGRMFGGKTEEVAVKVANVVDAVRGKPDAEEQVQKAISALPPEEQVELQRIQLESEKIRADVRKSEIDADTKQQAEAQATIRAELQYGNDYVKETRPRIARMSGVATALYVLVAEAANRISQAWGGPSVDGASVEVALMLFSPCGTYMTMRTIDAFSKGGKDVFLPYKKAQK